VAFKSVREFCQHMKTAYPDVTIQDLKTLDIDRKDNSLGYEPGNIRLLTRSENNRNTRRNRVVNYLGQDVYIGDLWHLLKHDFPDYAFSKQWTATLVNMGRSIEEVLGLDRMRKYRGVKSESTILSTPDQGIVSRYRER
jgi:hypothetical protein